MEKWYDNEEDILNIRLKDGEYWKSVEVAKGVILDISQDGSVLSVEILNASKLFPGELKKVIETAKKITV